MKSVDAITLESRTRLERLIEYFRSTKALRKLVQVRVNKAQGFLRNHGTLCNSLGIPFVKRRSLGTPA